MRKILHKEEVELTSDTWTLSAGILLDPFQIRAGLNIPFCGGESVVKPETA
jgi:hypothetical protein